MTLVFFSVSLPIERWTAVARSCRRRKRHFEARFITALGARFRMPTFNKRVLMLTAGALLATSACGGNANSSIRNSRRPGREFHCSKRHDPILKKLTKDVEIGSTVDPKMADMGPRAISLVRANFGLKKGQLLVCNFDDSTGTAGNGTTIEVLDPDPGSKPVTLRKVPRSKARDGGRNHFGK